MLIRISLIVAIVAGLGVGTLNFVKVKEKITTLQANLTAETAARQTAESDLADTRSNLERTTTELTQARQSLETANSEREKALAAANEQRRRATQLDQELSEAKTTLSDVQARLAAYEGTGLPPAQILALSQNLKDAQAAFAGAQQENTLLGRKIAQLDRDLRKYRGERVIVYLPSNLKGEVVVSDPKWDFVVLNVGEAQGVLPEGEMLVNRNGRLVAKVKVTNVQKDRSVANVIPGWKLGELLEGDQVIPAHPAS